jgi:urease accessory protein
MLIQQKIGNINTLSKGSRIVDIVELNWYESNKRILHKTTKSGITISLKFLNENQHLTDGDILFEDATTWIVVEITPCECIVIMPTDMKEMAAICYEIGNKHLPLFYYNDELLVAYEKPLFNLLLSGGYCVKQASRKLIHPLKTTVAPHGNGGDTLFSRILKLTT